MAEQTKDKRPGLHEYTMYLMEHGGTVTLVAMVSTSRFGPGRGPPVGFWCSTAPTTLATMVDEQGSRFRGGSTPAELPFQVRFLCLVALSIVSPPLSLTIEPPGSHRPGSSLSPKQRRKHTGPQSFLPAARGYTRFSTSAVAILLFNIRFSPSLACFAYRLSFFLSGFLRSVGHPHQLPLPVTILTSASVNFKESRHTRDSSGGIPLSPAAHSNSFLRLQTPSPGRPVSRGGLSIYPSATGPLDVTRQHKHSIVGFLCNSVLAAR